MSNDNSPNQPPHRDRGGQPGNQNARTHGFYAGSLTSQEQEHLVQAVELKGLHSEIAFLRVKLLALISSQRASPELLLRATRTLTRMVEFQDRITYGR